MTEDVEDIDFESLDALDKEKKMDGDMIAEWLKENEPTMVKDHKPTDQQSCRKAKNKNFVTDGAYQTGNRKGEAR